MDNKVIINIEVESAKAQVQLEEVKKALAGLKEGIANNGLGDLQKLMEDLRAAVGDLQSIFSTLNSDLELSFEFTNQTTISFNQFSAGVEGMKQTAEAAQGTLAWLDEEVKKLEGDLNNAQLGSDAFDTAKEKLDDMNTIVDAANDKINALTASAQLLNLDKVAEAGSAGMELLEKSSSLVTDVWGKGSDEAKVFAATIERLNTISKAYSVIQASANVMQKMGLISSTALSAGMVVQSGSVTLASRAWNFFKTALVSSGIGAIVILIGLLIANFKEVKQWISNALDSLGPFGKAIKAVFGVVQEVVGAIGDLFSSSSGKTAELSEEEVDAVKAAFEEAKKLRDEQYQNLEKTYDREIELRKARGEDTYDLEKEKNAKLVAFQKEQLKNLEAHTGATAELEKIRLEEIKKINDKIADLNQSQLVADAKHNEELKKNAEKANKEAVDRNKKALDDTRKYIDQLLEIYAKFNTSESDLKTAFTEKFSKTYNGKFKNFVADVYDATKAGIVNINKALDLVDQYNAAKVNSNINKATTFAQFLKDWETKQDAAANTITKRTIVVDFKYNATKLDAELKGKNNNEQKAFLDNKIKELEILKKYEDAGLQVVKDHLDGQLTLQQKYEIEKNNLGGISYKDWLARLDKQLQGEQNFLNQTKQNAQKIDDLNANLAADLTPDDKDDKAIKLQKELDATAALYDEQLKLYKDNADETKKLTEDKELALKNIRQKYDNEDLAEELKKKEDALRAEKILNLTALSDMHTQELALLQQQYDAKLITHEDFQKAKTEIDKRYEDERLAIIQEKLQIASQLTEASTNFISALRDAETANVEAQEQQGLISREQAEKKKKEIAKKYALPELLMNISKIVIDTAKAVMSMQSLPVPVNFIMSAIVAATGAAQIAKAKSEYNKVKAMARGGLVNGPRHAQGGVKYYSPGGVVELEGGEAVINRRSTQMYAPLLSAINKQGGGIQFAQGGILPAYSNSIVTQQIYQNASQFDYKALASIIASMPPPIVTVEDINSGQSKLTRIASRADI